MTLLYVDSVLFLCSVARPFNAFPFNIESKMERNWVKLINYLRLEKSGQTHRVVFDAHHCLHHQRICCSNLKCQFCQLVYNNECLYRFIVSMHSHSFIMCHWNSVSLYRTMGNICLWPRKLDVSSAFLARQFWHVKNKYQ